MLFSRLPIDVQRLRTSKGTCLAVLCVPPKSTNANRFRLSLAEPIDLNPSANGGVDRHGEMLPPDYQRDWRPFRRRQGPTVYVTVAPPVA